MTRWLATTILIATLVPSAARADEVDRANLNEFSRAIAAREAGAAADALARLGGIDALPRRCLEAWLREAHAGELARLPTTPDAAQVRGTAARLRQALALAREQAWCDDEASERRAAMAAHEAALERVERLAELHLASDPEPGPVSLQVTRTLMNALDEELAPIRAAGAAAWERVHAALEPIDLPPPQDLRWPHRTLNVVRVTGGVGGLSVVIALFGAIARPLFTGRDPRPWSAMFGGFFFGGFATILSAYSYVLPRMAPAALTFAAGVIAIGSAVVAKADSDRRRLFGVGIVSMGAVGALTTIGGFLHLHWHRTTRDVWERFLVLPSVHPGGGGLSLSVRL